MSRLAAFVSPHGYGHATRASAVMAALNAHTGARFSIWSATPRWLFDEAIEGLYSYHRAETDVGLRQRSALAYDLPATVRALEAMLPLEGEEIDRLAEGVTREGCRGVLCDISPMGIAVAERAGLPSILLENFLWPWIYAPLVREAPALAPLSQELASWFERAALHLQAEPLCDPVPGAVRLPPIARPPRTPRSAVRAAHGIPEEAPLVVLTMGGVDEALPFLDRLEHLAPVHFLVTGAAETVARANLRLFHKDTRIYMPDFVRAADAVVGKLGYGTVAEVWSVGRPYAYVTRQRFRETEALVPWAQRHLAGFEIPATEFADGAWITRLPELLAMRGEPPTGPGGAEEAARRIAEVAGLGG